MIGGTTVKPRSIVYDADAKGVWAAAEQLKGTGAMEREISGWLRDLGLERYEREFRANAIDLETLPELTETDLEKLGVLLGHRKRILRAAATLRPEATSPAAPTAPAIPAETAERRQLTVLFCDLVGSTALSARLDPEDLRDVLRRYQVTVEEEVARFDGFVARFMGDGALVYFGYPQAHEDDAERAVRTGLAIADRVAGLDDETAELHVRIGIATGLVVVGDIIGSDQAPEHDVIGETPNLASRLQSLAPSNGVLIAGATRRLAGDLFEYRDVGLLQIKGFAESVPVWQVLHSSAIEGRFAALRAPALTPLVGRDEEIELLLRRWSRAARGEGQVVLLAGEPGIGKSRVAAALRQALGDRRHIALQFFCSPHHQNSTLHPFATQIGRAAGFAREDSTAAKLDKLEGFLARTPQGAADAPALFADLLGLPVEQRYPPLPDDPQRKRERLLSALLEGVVAIARSEPLLMICEDIHWIDSTSLSVLDMLVERAPGLPLLLVITYRPEFAPGWVGQAHVTALAMNRLGPRESATLVERVAGGKALPDEILAGILKRTDGIPLFIEELTKVLLEGGWLREETDRFVLDGSLPRIAIPPSLHASLLARLDRLAAVKEVAQTGAALGREFSYDLVAAVVGGNERDLQEALERLTAAGLIHRRGVSPRISFLFKHALVQDAAYSTLLRSQRRQLHRRIAEVLVERFPETAESQPEILAHHYTEAGILPLAIDFWRRAGEQALRGSANAEAVRHLTRGVELLQQLPATADRNHRELGLYLALGPAMRALKGHATAEVLDVYSRARALINDHASVREQMSVLYGLWIIQFTRWDVAAAGELAKESLARSQAHPDSDFPVLANSLMGNTLWAQGEFSEARSYLTHSLNLSVASQNQSANPRAARNHAVAVLSFLGFTMFALGFPEQAAAATRLALTQARATGHVPLTAMALHNQAFMVAAFNADPKLVGTEPEEAEAFCIEHGVAAYEHWARFWQGVVLARRGEAARAIDIMQSALAVGEQLGVGLFRSAQYAYLAAAHAQIGQPDAAQELFTDALGLIDTAKERFFAAEVHRLYGEFLLAQQSAEPAAAQLKAALEVARVQQAKLWELRAAMALARLRCGERSDENARGRLTAIFDWFSEGHGTVDLVAARRLLEHWK